jgi:hypothetical protein
MLVLPVKGSAAESWVWFMDNMLRALIVGDTCGFVNDMPLIAVVRLGGLTPSFSFFHLEGYECLVDRAASILNIMQLPVFKASYI